MQSFNQSLDEGFYRLFWQSCGTHGLTKKEKIEALCQLSKFSLKIPYYSYGEDMKVDGKTLAEMFPKLVPANLCKEHVHLQRQTGLMLYVIQTELFKEIRQSVQNGKLTGKQIAQIKESTQFLGEYHVRRNEKDVGCSVGFAIRAESSW